MASKLYAARFRSKALSLEKADLAAAREHLGCKSRISARLEGD